MTGTTIDEDAPSTTTIDVSRSFSKNVFNHVACAWYVIGDGSLTLRGAPRTEDRRRAASLAHSAGLSLVESGHTVSVSGTPRATALSDEVCRSRISICQATALAARTGWASIRVGGGCGFDHRPVDVHVRVVQAAGGEVRPVGDRLEISFPRRPGGALLDVRTAQGTSSVGASVTALLVAALATSPSEIYGLSQGPEVRALTTVLRHMGADITIAEDQACVRGVGGPVRHDVSWDVPLDEIAVGTYALMGLARSGQTCLRGAAGTRFFPGFSSALAQAGVGTVLAGDDLILSVSNAGLRPTAVTTGPYPGFPTDLAPPWSALMALADGASTITETVYRRRDSHVAGLRSAGVDVTRLSPNTYRVRGPSRLSQRPVLEVRDIRCGDAFMVVAAGSSSGAVLVDAQGHLPRGHSRPRALLSDFGAELRGAPDVA